MRSITLISCFNYLFIELKNNWSTSVLFIVPLILQDRSLASSSAMIHQIHL